MTYWTRTSLWRLLALLCAFVLIAAACSSGDDDDDAAIQTNEPAATTAPEPEPEANATPATAEPAPQEVDEEPPVEMDFSSGPADDSLEPVRIGLLNQENDVIGSFPEFRLGVEGAVAYLNAENGGINGHPIEIVSCVQNGVEKAQECAQELASSDLVSLMNGVNIWTFAFDFYATMGDTPIIGGLPLFASDYNQPNARYFNGGSISIYAAMARFAAEELGAKKVAVLVNSNPAADAAVADGLAPIFEQFGIEFVNINVPLPLTDAIPAMSEVPDDADLVMLLAAQNEWIPVIRAASQLGIEPERMFYSGTCAAADVYAEVGDLIVGSWMARGGFVNEDPWAPQEVKDLLAQFEANIEVYAPEAPDAVFTSLGWATLNDLHDLYEEIGFENLANPANIFAAMDDGQSRGRVGSYGWSCIYEDAGLVSLCSGDNLFVEIADSDGNSLPPVNDGAYVNGLSLLEG
jgi:ABC-type branched-subunit amino acid transport system substrate-binding protein